MRYLLICFLAYSGQSLAKMPIKKGLWKTNNKFTLNGEVINIKEKLDQALALIPEAQHGFVKEMLKAKFGGQLAEDVMSKQLCVTDKMIESPVKYIKRDGDCKILKEQHVKNKWSYDLKCSDGSGKLEWIIKSDKSYTGSFTGKSSKDDDVKIAFAGEFKSAKCK